MIDVRNTNGGQKHKTLQDLTCVKDHKPHMCHIPATKKFSVEEPDSCDYGYPSATAYAHLQIAPFPRVEEKPLISTDFQHIRRASC